MEPCPGGEIPNIYIESTAWFWDEAYEATFIERETTPTRQNEEDNGRPNEQSIDSNSNISCHEVPEGMIDKISNIIFDLKLFKF